VAAAALAADAIASSTSDPARKGALALGVVALIALLGAVTFLPGALPWSMVALLGAFATSLAGRPVPDLRTILWAADLVLVGELAGWADELRVGAIEDEPLALRAGRRSAALVALAAAVSAPVLIAGAGRAVSGEVVAAGGVVAAAGALGLVVALARPRRFDSES
jgi:hypothetical protein